MAYCDFHRLGRDIIILEGQDLLLGKQGDVAQIVLHRRGGVLTILDSGVFDEDREAIVRAARELGDFSRVVLVNSHGHVDHVGNNDVIYELGTIEVEHYVPRKDYPNLCDQAGFFVQLMDEASRYLDMGSPVETVDKLMALFRKPRHNADRVIMLEDRFDLETCTVADVSFQAYRVGNVLVIPTEGHTVGHVCFFFEDEGFFYGADEFIGAVAPWGDSSPDRQLTACRLVIDLVEAGGIKHAARGHHWGHVSGRDFATVMQSVIDETEQWHRHMGKLLQSHSLTIPEMIEAMRDRMPDSFGPNSNALFDTMKVLNTCHRLDATQQGDPPTAVFSRRP